MRATARPDTMPAIDRPESWPFRSGGSCGLVEAPFDGKADELDEELEVVDVELVEEVVEELVELLEEVVLEVVELGGCEVESDLVLVSHVIELMKLIDDSCVGMEFVKLWVCVGISPDADGIVAMTLGVS